MRFRVFVECPTPGCEKRGTVVNTVTSGPFDDRDELESELELFLDGWEGDDPADRCPACRQRGVLREGHEQVD
ncbi:MAG: hypothetical protein JNJ54_30875 [Myxococcaceae bacterium]|nr:hypothetical protein [Myxococcaceae bacterium]